jgi:excisionase family DNA binding protein
VTQRETPARYLTITEAAAALRVSTATVFRLVTGGDLPARRVGSGYLVRDDDVERRLAARAVGAR